MEMDVFDFDRTIYAGDSSVDFWLFALRRYPFIAVLLPFQLLGWVLCSLRLLSLETHKQWFFCFMRFIPGGKAIGAFWAQNKKKLNTNLFEDFLVRPSVVISSSPEFLVRPACENIGFADIIATDVDIRTGRMIGSNCKKAEKLNRIKQKYPDVIIKRVFTDSVKNDLHLLEAAEQGFLVKNKQITPLTREAIARAGTGMYKKVMAVVRLLRPRQYVKNMLIFFALFFSGILKAPAQYYHIWDAVLAFFLFCLCSSGVYIINDIFDMQYDKLHPYKKFRPITMGLVSVNFGYVLSMFLMLIPLVWSYFLNVTCFAIIIIYIALNLLYSTRLKRVPLVDVVIVSLGFVLRAFMGGYAIDVQLSPFMILTVTAGSLFLAFGKRKNEHRDSFEGDTRYVLKLYPQRFLDQATISMMVLTITFYTLWTITGLSARNPVSIRMVYTTPVFILTMLRYSMLLEGSSSGDPVDVVTRDWMMLGLVFIFVTLVTVFTYF